MVSVFDLLDREWARLCGDDRVTRRLPDVCEAAGGAGSLAAVERFVRTAGPDEADRVLVALVARAVEGDALAARVLLQLLLPGVRRLARTWWALGDAEERAAAAVAATYDRIRRYPLARRPCRVAANVLMDAAGDLRRAARASAGPIAEGYRPDTAEPGWEPVAADPVHPAVELIDVLADAVSEGRLSAADAELIAASRIAGTSLSEIARRRGAKLRTLQWRRKRAEAALVSL
jgi:DNA-directed RNA polymerase specialized sigma24 family protein